MERDDTVTVRVQDGPAFMRLHSSITMSSGAMQVYIDTILFIFTDLSVSIKGALTSFGVMCKIIAFSIQSCLLYVPANFQGLKTNRTRATINFLKLFKTGNYFCGIVVCYVKVRFRCFVKTFCHGRTPIYKTIGCAKRFLCVVFVE